MILMVWYDNDEWNDDNDDNDIINEWLMMIVMINENDIINDNDNNEM